MNKKSLNDLQFEGKKTLVRVDFNVPIKDGKVTDANRIKAALPTINYLIENKAKLILFSHLGRIASDEDKKKNSLKPVAKELEKLLGKKVKFIPETRGKELEESITSLKEGEILMFENTRFEDFANGEQVKLESKNDPALGKYWASLGDVFVNDAFGTAHRAHASNVGIASNIEDSCLGLLVEKEVDVFQEIISNPKRPFVAIMGGAKVSDKIMLIDQMLKLADKIVILGAMAYTFEKAKGNPVGTSRVEEDKVSLAKKYLDENPNKFILPIDHAVAKEFADVKPEYVNTVPEGMMGLDCGPKTVALIAKEISNAKTVVWNGPAGVFEFDNYAFGTKEICKKIAELDAFTVIGGGDSAAAAIKYGFEDKFSHISTGGGASLEFLEGKELPGIAAIKNK